MKKAAVLLLKTSNFKALCKHPDSYNNTLRQISKCELFINQEQGRLRFSVTSDRLLRGMLRIFVFFLLEVGK
jgi:tRNA pseudouridine38-40 synthase